MGWVHGHKRHGALFALAALALQIVLSFGHVHLDGLRLAATHDAVTVRYQTAAAQTSTQIPGQNPGTDDDYCAICASEYFVMFSPAACARYQSAVQASDSPTDNRGCQPKVFCAKAEDSVRALASLRCVPASRRQPGRPENLALNASTTSRTVQKDDGSGPKLTARGLAAGPCTSACANAR